MDRAVLIDRRRAARGGPSQTALPHGYPLSLFLERLTTLRLVCDRPWIDLSMEFVPFIKLNTEPNV
jgi:hypothetical protein